LVGTNNVGKGYSADLTFTTLQMGPPMPPLVTVSGATNITSTTATIAGAVNPNSLATTVHVVYGPTAAYGDTSAYVDLPLQGTAVPLSTPLTGLSPSTTYHYQVIATNSAGESTSTDMTFTTAGGQAPTVTVTGVTYLTSSNAFIGGTVNPNGLPTGYYVEWGTSTVYGMEGSGGTLDAQSPTTTVTAGMFGLSPSTTYHCRLVATNADGIGYSGDLTLATLEATPPTPPTVATGQASGVTDTAATLTGTINPNGWTVTYYFLWGTTTAYGNVTPIVWPVDGSNPSIAYATLSGLSPGTTYHFQLVATNIAGSASGADATFTTLNSVTVNGNSFVYIVANGAVTIVSCSGPGGVVNIPATIGGLPVAVIGPSSFSLPGLTAVFIPEGVTTIADSAFELCAGLTNVSMPGSLTYIGPGSFNQCTALANVTIPMGVTNIGAQAFQGCSLTRVTIPDSVVELQQGTLSWGGPQGAFYGCGALTNVIVGKGLVSLGAGTFGFCGNLTAIYFMGNAPFAGDVWGAGPFYWANSAVVYYMPGSTGWGSTYAGRPALLWNPQPLTGAGSFGVGQNGFGFNITGTADIPLMVEASEDPTAQAWVPLQSCTLTNGSIYFSDPEWKNHPGRFYRIRSP
jgi:hypothetical protein